MAADTKRDGPIRHGRGDSMSGRGRSGGLQVIFSFFLGLMVTAFVGVGAYTFHPPPHEQLARQMQQLDRREVAVRDSRPPEQLTAEDRVQIQMLNSERDQLSDAMQQAREGWARSTSIILITLATLVMAVSLVRSEQLPVVGNGLLLGGLFTMVYGIGWIISTETSIVPLRGNDRRAQHHAGPGLYPLRACAGITASGTGPGRRECRGGGAGATRGRPRGAAERRGRRAPTQRRALETSAASRQRNPSTESALQAAAKAQSDRCARASTRNRSAMLSCSGILRPALVSSTAYRHRPAASRDSRRPAPRLAA